MRIFQTLLIAGALSFAGSVASASTLIFNFEDANNGDKEYFNSGFLFDPVNLNSSTRCAEDGDNPKHCFLEVMQGDFTDLQTADETEVEGEYTNIGEDSFDLLGFYINFQGTGSSPDNEMTLSGWDALTDELYMQSVVVGEGYTDGGDVNPLGTATELDDYLAIYLADEIYEFGDAATQYEGPIEEQVGYFVVVLGGFFDGIDLFRWDASDGANNRVDCVAVSTGGTELSLSDFQSCAVAPLPPNPIPLPAAGWFLLAGLGGLAALRKRA